MLAGQNHLISTCRHEVGEAYGDVRLLQERTEEMREMLRVPFSRQRMLVLS